MQSGSEGGHPPDQHLQQTHLVAPPPDEVVEADAGGVDSAGQDQRGPDADEDVRPLVYRGLRVCNGYSQVDINKVRNALVANRIVF